MAEYSTPHSQSPPALSESRASVLLVDDNHANILSLRTILQELDLRLVEALSGEEAFQRVQSEEFAVVFLDVVMPGLDGFATAKLIRNFDRSRHTPIIFLTAYDIDRAQVEEAYALGAVDFLEKPFAPIALRAKVRGLSEIFLDKQQARREADQLRLLVHGTVDYAIFMLDPEGRIATWNPGAERLHGYKAEELIGRNFSQLFPKEAVEANRPEHELEVARREGRFEDEGWRLRKDGSCFWANVIITALRDEHGRLRGYSKVTRDLTDRKQAEEALRQSEERFRLIVEGVSDYAIFLLDTEGRVASWNPGAQRIKQYRAEEIIGQHFSRFYPQEAIDRGWPQYELEVAKKVGRFEDEGWRVRKDGTEFWANVVITALHDGAGKFRGFSKITRDLTERKRAEEEARRLLEETTARRVAEENARVIQEQRERLRVTLASIGDAVISTDVEGRVAFLNPVAERLLGWKDEEAAGHGLEEVFHIVNAETRSPVENPVVRALREALVVGLANHTLLLSKDGTERPIDDSAAPIRDAENKVIGCVLVFRDVAEQKRAEQQRNARTAATHALNQAADLNEAAAGVLHAVCQSLAWDIGLFWTVNADGTALVCRQCRHAPGVSVEEFEEDSRNRSFAKGEGLPGRVWESGKSAWILDLTHDDNFPRLNSAVRHGLRSAVACPIIIGDQTLGVIEFFASRIREPDADLMEMMTTIAGSFGQFIERKTAEEELRDKEQRFRQLADAMPQIVWSARPNGNIDYLNRRWSEFTGLPSTSGNDAWADIVHPEDAQPAVERWSASLQSGEPFEMEIRLLDRRAHAYRWHLIRTVAMRNESGHITRWFGTSTDIHEQKKAEESSRFLADASGALAGVVDHESTLQKIANMAVPYFADWSAVDVATNGKLRRLAVAHQDPEKIELAHELMRLYPPSPDAKGGSTAVFRTGTAEFMSELPEELLAQGAKDKRHFEMLRALGLKSYICVPLVVSGETLGVLTFATAESGRQYSQADLALASDLANRAAVAIENTQLYQALRETDRRKDEFLATLAHELRNPLAPIRNALQILKMPRVDAEAAERSREMMERQVHHLVRLVDDLLDVSRVMRGKIELRKEHVELASIVARAVETVQPLIDTQGHRLTVQLPADSLLIDADPVRLAQVVGNLLTNAAKYTEPNGEIRLIVEREGDTAAIRVQDTGIGIAPDMLPLVFELFVQVDSSSTRSQGGLGIGLTLVKNLVEMHNGAVEAHSAGLGKGSEFVVRLPLCVQSKDQGREKLPRAPERVPASGCRVLVVDDKQDAADSLAMLLRLQGHEVRTAYSGMAALDMAKDYVPDVAFLDIGMPGMDGYEAARRIRRQPGLSKVVLVALTGWGQLEDRRRSNEAGFNHHIVKPAEPKVLENVMAELVSRTSESGAVERR
jgi:PAS domain S-box-containing protein